MRVGRRSQLPPRLAEASRSLIFGGHVIYLGIRIVQDLQQVGMIDAVLSISRCLCRSRT